MNHQKIQNEYPHIAKIIPAIQTSSSVEKTIAFYTTKIEKEGNQEVLTEWITYLSNKNSLQAINAVNKLHRISEEEREKFMELILKRFQKIPESFLKWQILMRILLSLEKIEDAKNLYEYLLYLSNPKVKETLNQIQECSLEETHEIVKEIIKNSTKYHAIFLEDLSEVEKKLAEVVQKYQEETHQLEEKATTTTRELLGYLESQEPLLKEYKIEINNIELEDTSSSLFWKLLKLINKLTKLEDTALETVVETLREYEVFFKKNGKALGDLQEKSLKEYKELQNQIFPKIEEIKNGKQMYLEVFNYKLNNMLLQESNYSQIFTYIYILQKVSLEEGKRLNFSRFKLAPKTTNKEKIQRIVNEYIEQGDLYAALQFLKDINVSKYEEFLPKEHSLFEYRNRLSQMELEEKEKVESLLIEQELFLEESSENNLLDWLKILDNETPLTEPIAINKLTILIELHKENRLIFQEEYFAKKKEELSNFYQTNLWTLYPSKMMEQFMRDIQKILEEDISIKEKKILLKELEGINPFQYRKAEKQLPYWTKKINNYNTIKVKGKILFQKLLESYTNEELEDLVYIYMNTNIKYIIPIEEFIKESFEKDGEGILLLLKEYTFYGIVSQTKQTDRYRVELKNVLNLNRALVEDTNRKKIGEITEKECTAEIEEYDSIYNTLMVKISQRESIEELQEIESYKEYYESEEETEWNPEGNGIEGLLEEIVEFQVNLLENYKESYSTKLEHDFQNPYRYWNDSDFQSLPNDFVIRDTIERLKKQKSSVQSLKDLYYERINQAMDQVLTKENVPNIITFYMNTSIRYLLELENFFEKIYQKEDRNEVVANCFEPYDILFFDIQEDNTLEEILQLNSNAIQGNFNQIIRELSNGLTYLKGKIKSYKRKKQTIEIKKIQYTDITRNSKEYHELNQILEEYLNTKEKDKLKEVKEIEQITELKEKEISQYAYDHYLFYLYRRNYISVVLSLMDNLEDLKEFLELLGKNNYYKEIQRKDATLSKSESMVNLAKLFLKSAKSSSLETVIYCYQNSFIRNIVPIDKLINTLFRHHELGIQKVNAEGIIDLSTYALKIYCRLKEKENTYFLAESPKAKLEIKNQDDVTLKRNNYFLLEIQSYNIRNNTITVLAEEENPIQNYNEKAIQTLLKVISPNYPIEEIRKWLEETQKENIYYEYSANVEYVENLLQNFKEEKEALKTKIESYLKKRKKSPEMRSKIDSVIEIYDKTLIRYIVSLKEFIVFLQELGKEDIHLTFYIRLIKKNLKDEYVHFLRYKYSARAKVEKSSKKELEEGQKYKVWLHYYDTANELFRLEIQNEETE